MHDTLGDWRTVRGREPMHEGTFKLMDVLHILIVRVVTLPTIATFLKLFI